MNQNDLNKFLKSNKIFDLKNIEDLQKLDPNFLKNEEKSFKNLSNNVEILVFVRFLTHQAINGAQNLFIWSYKIKIKNLRDKKIKLLKRHFEIFDAKNNFQQVDGEGVVGLQPTIEAGKTFEYSSGVHLSCEDGVMSGHYEFENELGETFLAKLPSFSLAAPHSKASLN